MSDGTKIFLGIVVVFAAFGALVFGGRYLAERVSCSNYQEATGRETKMQAMTCYVKMPNGWFSRSQVRSGTE